MKQNNHTKSLLALVFAAALLMAVGGLLPCYAEEAAPAGGAADILSEVSLIDYLNIKEYEYSKEGRHDPFMPPIEQIVEQEESTVEEMELLAGMRRFETEQLTLVAILGTDENRVAMVQDTDGKGYVITVGTKIGRGGVVQDIVPNRVIIRETRYTMAGEEQISTIDMLLRKGEKD